MAVNLVLCTSTKFTLGPGGRRHGGGDPGSHYGMLTVSTFLVQMRPTDGFALCANSLCPKGIYMAVVFSALASPTLKEV